MSRLVTAAPALVPVAAMVIAGIWAVVHSIRAGTHGSRRGLRRLHQYANHPGSRPILDDFHQPRKEKP